MTTLKEAAAIMSAAAHKPTPKRTAHCKKIAKLPRTSDYVCRACGHRQSSKWINMHDTYHRTYIPCVKCEARALLFRPEK